MEAAPGLFEEGEAMSDIRVYVIDETGRPFYRLYFDCVMVLIESKLFRKQSFRQMDVMERSKSWNDGLRCVTGS
jgi:DNA topoisomerase IB